MQKKQLQLNNNHQNYTKTRFSNNKIGFSNTVKLIGLNTVRYGYNTVKAGYTVTNKTLFAINSTTKAISKVTARQVVRVGTEKFKQSSVDDISRGLVSSGTIVKDLYSGLKKRNQGKKNYALQKQKYKFKKNDKFITAQKDRKVLTQFKEKHLLQKQNVKLHKIKYKSFKKSLSSKADKKDSSLKLRKQLYKRRKDIFKEKSKDFKKVKYAEKQIQKLKSKELKWQNRAKKKAKPRNIISQPLHYGARKLGSNLSFRALTADPNNDFTQATKVGKNIAKEINAQNKAKRFKKDKKRINKIDNKIAKNQSKFITAKNRLESQKHYIESTRKNWKRRQRRRQYKYKANSIKGIKERLKKGSQRAAKGLIDTVKKSIIALLPVLIIAIILLTLLLAVFSILTKSGFILGTFNADDDNMAQAEEYYTEKLYDINQDFLSIESDWRSGFSKFGISTNHDDPNSVHCTTTDIDYDPYTLLAFLTAYSYDYDKTSDEQDMWEFDGDLEDACDQLISTEWELMYQFFTYKNSKGDKSVSLSYWMNKKGSMVEAAKSILGNLDNSDERISYFELLLYGDSGNVYYGNHQSIPLPLEGLGMDDIEESNNVYNNYGYDIRTWGEKQHCNLDDNEHEAVDIIAKSPTHVISPVDGEIIDYDGNNYIVIEAKNVKIWESTRRDLRITLRNVYSNNLNLKEGDKVTKGQVIGVLSVNDECNDNCDNSELLDIKYGYLHCQIEVKYFVKYKFIDPTTFFNRQAYEQKEE